MHKLGCKLLSIVLLEVIPTAYLHDVTQIYKHVKNFRLSFSLLTQRQTTPNSGGFHKLEWMFSRFQEFEGNFCRFIFRPGRWPAVR